MPAWPARIGHDRQVVEQAAVDEHLTLGVGHRREDPGHREARSDRLPARAVAVDLEVPGREVGGDAERRPPGVLEIETAGAVLDALGHARAGRERQRRQRDVDRRPALDEGGAQQRRGGVAVEAARDGTGDDRSDARPTGGVDGHTVRLEGAEHADVRDAARAATAEHDPEAAVEHEAGDPGPVRGVARRGRGGGAGPTRGASQRRVFRGTSVTGIVDEDELGP